MKLTGGLPLLYRLAAEEFPDDADMMLELHLLPKHPPMLEVYTEGGSCAQPKRRRAIQCLRLCL